MFEPHIIISQSIIEVVACPISIKNFEWWQVLPADNLLVAPLWKGGGCKTHFLGVNCIIMKFAYVSLSAHNLRSYEMYHTCSSGS
jgi:hypothetical protein